jgi:serum/glucocorticoid-regulated kinase 2
MEAEFTKESKDGDLDLQTYQRIIDENAQNKGNVTKDDFEIYALLGEGSYGKVILVKKKDSGV